MKKIVVIGFVGTKLDNYRGQSRWDKWRPSIALTQQSDVAVTRFELMYNGPVDSLIGEVAADIAAVSPETQVVPHALEMEDAWDFEEVYGALFDFAKRYSFDPDNEDYWIHITTGTHVAQICLFLMTSSNSIARRCTATARPRRCSATSRARSRARHRIARDCSGVRTRDCSSSTKSVNSARTNRPCC